MAQNKSKTVNRLLKEYKNGSSTALEELMLLTYKELYLISYSYTKDSGLAEDAVSETFIKLMTKIHTVKNEKNLNGYLRTIVINQSLDILRKRKREVYPGDDFFATQTYEQNEQNLQPILDEMQPNQCEVLLLWHYGYTLNEISQKTDSTVNKVRLLLEKAKTNFTAIYHKFMQS